MGIPTYGAILAKNKILQDEIKKMQVMVNCLNEETEIQRMVINLYRNLLKSYTLPNKARNYRNYCCDLGHFDCKIDHARYGLVRKTLKPARIRILTNPQSHKQIQNEVVAVK